MGLGGRGTGSWERTRRAATFLLSEFYMLLMCTRADGRTLHCLLKATGLAAVAFEYREHDFQLDCRAHPKAARSIKISHVRVYTCTCMIDLLSESDYMI